MTFKRPIHTCLVLIGLVFAVACSQQTEKQPESVPAEVESVAQGIVISDAWARPTMTPGQPGGAYLTVVNNTDQDDRMIAVASSRAGRTMMHDNVHVDGVVRMVMMENVAIPAGGRVAFVPGGKHIMLFGLDAPLQAGQEVPLTLTFEHAGDIAITATVSADMSGPAMNPAMKMDHGH